MSATKIGENTTNILTTIFQTKFTLWQIKLNICMSEIKFTSHQQYLFGCLFFPVSKETTHKPSKVGQITL